MDYNSAHANLCPPTPDIFLCLCSQLHCWLSKLYILIKVTVILVQRRYSYQDTFAVQAVQLLFLIILIPCSYILCYIIITVYRLVVALHQLSLPKVESFTHKLLLRVHFSDNSTVHCTLQSACMAKHCINFVRMCAQQ